MLGRRSQFQITKRDDKARLPMADKLHEAQPEDWFRQTGAHCMRFLV